MNPTTWGEEPAFPIILIHMSPQSQQSMQLLRLGRSQAQTAMPDSQTPDTSQTED